MRVVSCEWWVVRKKEFRIQNSEDRIQKTEDRRQKTERGKRVEENFRFNDLMILDLKMGNQRVEHRHTECATR